MLIAISSFEAYRLVLNKSGTNIGVDILRRPQKITKGHGGENRKLKLLVPIFEEVIDAAFFIFSVNRPFVQVCRSYDIL